MLAIADEAFFTDKRKIIKRHHENLLMNVYDWLASSNPPISRTIDGKRFYLINYSFLSSLLGTNYANIKNYIKRLCDDSNGLRFFSKTLTKGKNGHTYAWLSINQHLARKALRKDSKAYMTLFPRNDMTNEPLFEADECKIDFPEEAIAIVNRVLTKYSCYFKNRIPSPNTMPTKNYLDALRKITDIYNGTFTNPHVYSLSEKFNTNKQFGGFEWRGIIKEVRGDWGKVRKLIFDALKNFDKMHLPMYLPFSKEYLQTNFSLWLFDKWEGQSQFIQCLAEPWEVKTLLGEEKADRIYKKLPEQARKAGNRFFNMNNDIGSVALWQGIKDMLDWSKEVFKYDYGAGYWAESYKEIPLKFQEWCVEHDIKISSSTMNMEKAIITNAPWKWFVSEAIEKHGMNKRLLKTFNAEQVKRIYEKNDESSIPF